MKTYFLHFVLLAAGIAGVSIFPGPIPQSIFAAFIGGGIVFFLNELIQRPVFLRSAIWALLHPRKEVRISIAALLQIKVGDQYVLVYGGRRQQYQPVGGALQSLPDCRLPFPTLADPAGLRKDNDLRFGIGAVTLPKLVKWVNSEKDRELSPWREFWEEMIEPKILPNDIFPFISTRFVRRLIPMPTISREHNGVFQLRVFEIFSVSLSSEQVRSLQDAIDKEDSSDPARIRLVDAESIKRGWFAAGKDPDKRIPIGDHSVHILEG